jgi:hypothetical protein
MEETHIGKRNVFVFLLLIITIQFIGLVLGIIHNHFGSDFAIYYTNTKSFWLNQEIYQTGFFYLNYFYFLCVWMFLLPEIIGLFLHILLTDLMFYYIMKSIKDYYELYWFYANIVLILIHSATFNTDIWIVFGFLLFLKKSTKWYSPFFLLLCFFKITPILTFVLFFLILLHYERKMIIKMLPSLTVVFLIILISFLTSTGLISSVAGFWENLINETGIIVFFQPPHFIWWSLPLMALIRYKRISNKLSKKIWVIYTCITLFYGFLILILSTSVISDYIFTDS